MWTGRGSLPSRWWAMSPKPLDRERDLRVSRGASSLLNESPHWDTTPHFELRWGDSHMPCFIEESRADRLGFARSHTASETTLSCG